MKPNDAETKENAKETTENTELPVSDDVLDDPMDEKSLESFLKTAGQIDIDGDAITRLREESLI